MSLSNGVAKNALGKDWLRSIELLAEHIAPGLGWNEAVAA